jgi:hypothetical protein
MVRWIPRILGIAVSLFLGLFALDAFQPGRPLAATVTEFAIHLIPAAVVIALVAVSWWRAWLAGAAFVALAAAYALAGGLRLDWIAAISGPLLTVGVLFLWSWRRQLAATGAARPR